MSKGRLLVAGATGRIGQALLPHLDDFDLTLLGRLELTDVGIENVRQQVFADDGQVDAILNLAGKAHLARNEESATAELRESNVSLPLRLAGLADVLDTNFIHLSSTKAALDGRSDAYAQSKHDAENELRSTFDAKFSTRGKALVALRIPATLAPPFDAGKLGLLRRVAPLLPKLPIVLPTLAVEDLAAIIGQLLRDSPAGFSIREIPKAKRATLAQVKEALTASGED